MKKTKYLCYHPGKYFFQIPYTTFNPIPNAKGFVNIHKCNIELFVGYDYTKDKSNLCEVYIISDYRTIGTTNFISQIATNVFLTIIQSIFDDNILNEKWIYKSIKWFEVYTKEAFKELNHNGMIKEVFLDWNINKRQFENPIFEVKKYTYGKAIERKLIIQEGDIVNIFKKNNTLSSKQTEEYLYVIISYIKDNCFLGMRINNIIDKSTIQNLNLNSIESIQKHYNTETIEVVNKKEILSSILRVKPSVIKKLKEIISKNIIFKDSYSNLRFFEKDSNINIYEGSNYEFKSLENTNPKNKIRSICKDVEKYVVGFLNGRGGSIFFGISDKNIIEGILLSPNERDLLQRKIMNEVCENIKPQSVRLNVEVIFNNISQYDEYIENLYIIEAIIMPTKNLIYSTKEGSVYHHKNATNKKLTTNQINDLQNIKYKR